MYKTLIHCKLYMFVGRQKIKEEKRKKEEMNDGRKKLSNTVDVYF